MCAEEFINFARYTKLAVHAKRQYILYNSNNIFWYEVLYVYRFTGKAARYGVQGLNHLRMIIYWNNLPFYCLLILTYYSALTKYVAGL